MGRDDHSSGAKVLSTSSRLERVVGADLAASHRRPRPIACDDLSPALALRRVRHPPRSSIARDRRVHAGRRNTLGPVLCSRELIS